MSILNEQVKPTHFRLSDHWTEDGRVVVEVEKFYPIKETPCGYWVVSEFHWEHRHHFPDWLEKQKRWTARDGGRYLHASLGDALRHFGLRKRHELRHIRARLDKANRVQDCWGLLTVEALESGGVDLGMPGEQTFKLEPPVCQS